MQSDWLAPDEMCRRQEDVLYDPISFSRGLVEIPMSNLEYGVEYSTSQCLIECISPSVSKLGGPMNSHTLQQLGAAVGLCRSSPPCGGRVPRCQIRYPV